MNGTLKNLGALTARHWEANGVEFLGPHRVLESGKKWALAKTPVGFLRYFEGQPLEIFEKLDAALEDCGVIGVLKFPRDGQGESPSSYHGASTQ